MNKRIITVFFILIMAVSLTACGSQPAQTQQSPAPDATKCSEVDSSQDTPSSDTEVHRKEISDTVINNFSDLEQFGAEMFYAADEGSRWTSASGWAQADSLSADRGFSHIALGTKDGRFEQLDADGKVFLTLGYIPEEKTAVSNMTFQIPYPDSTGEATDFGHGTYMTQEQFDFLVDMVKLCFANPDNPYVNCVPEKLADIAEKHNCYFAVNGRERWALYIVSDDHTFGAPEDGKKKAIRVDADGRIVWGVYSNWGAGRLSQNAETEGYDGQYFDEATFHWNLSDAYITEILEPAIEQMVAADSQ